LRELGWIEGQNLTVEYRGAPTIDRMTELAADLVRLKVDVILAPATPQVEAANRVTKKIPIVFSNHANPVAAGHVSSLAHPGGNITGLSNLMTDLTVKGLQIVNDAFPSATVIGALAEANHPLAQVTMKALEAEASNLGLRVHTGLARSPDEFEVILSTFKQAGITAFIAWSSPLTWNGRDRLAASALKYELAGVSSAREMAESGLLMSYGPYYLEMFRRAADYVDKILRGAGPADLPVEQASKYELLVNLKTAKALGLAIPPPLLARADEVIE
jgi:putative tryptophan/tyrosine transport system substrate-binding protein